MCSNRALDCACECCRAIQPPPQELSPYLIGSEVYIVHSNRQGASDPHVPKSEKVRVLSSRWVYIPRLLVEVRSIDGEDFEIDSRMIAYGWDSSNDLRPSQEQDEM